MNPDERARRVVQAFRDSPDRSMKGLLQLVSEALRECVLEEREACLRAMYTGLDLGKIERAVWARGPRPKK